MHFILVLDVLNILVSLLVDVVLWFFDKNRSGPKVDLSGKKKNMLLAKSIYEFFPERSTFGTEFGSVKAMVSMQELKLIMMKF